ncbi:DNA repair protein RadC [Paenibacillus sp. LS1]|uniref:JAB domain-containing protein n=1 Tax=Paenibacillus sp. LS1 TaxID=2992120 RepID=UPI00223040B1|nr:DNA repair protein RadC [Paenibacillus sp. LS1]MCW3795413.1 DNA repair protein RadC [Paenibacillus sp. LS1]
MGILNEEIKALFSEVLMVKPSTQFLNDLSEKYSTLFEFLSTSQLELENRIGLPECQAKKIISMISLFEELHKQELKDYIVRSPRDLVGYLISEYKFVTKEHFICVFLNSKNKIIHKEIISIGSLNAAIVHPREVFNAAIRHCSASLICVHNHPSGDSTPSEEDIKITKRLVDVGEIVGIEVLDHLILGGNSYYSLKEHGHI